MIQRAVHQMNRLIQDLLDVTRIEAGQLSISRQPHSAAALISEAIDFHRPQLEERKLHLERDLAEELPQIFADGDRVLQVLGNLLGNAIKFTAEGGKITLGARPDGDMVLITVSDTGPGIVSERLPHLFDRFWQASRRTKQGAGLGLAIARAIVEAHGGRIRVESEVGVGTTLFFTFPVVGSEGEDQAAG